jgi:hypothetical protein
MAFRLIHMCRVPPSVTTSGIGDLEFNMPHNIHGDHRAVSLGIFHSSRSGANGRPSSRSDVRPPQVACRG